ncbi:S1 RNA binding domain-containing protein [Cryptosporidium felis]|nr:S1 RNA binding domain-containing protein [Cryptosporidium felis]
MSRKKTLRNRENEPEQMKVEEEDDVEYGDFIGIKSKNIKSNISSSNLERKDLKLGTLLFGIIDQVTDKELLISLPGSNSAIVSLENTLEIPGNIPTDLFCRLRKVSLKDRFRPGDPVNGAVISNTKVKNNITLNPSILNAGLNSNSRSLDIPGYVVSAIIISKENHGFNLFTGIQGIKSAFLRVGGCEKSEFRLGQILPVSIDKFFKDKSLLVCASISEESPNSKFIGRKELLSIHEIKPGLKVECLIHSFGSGSDLPQKRSLSSPKKKKRFSSEKVGVQPNVKVLQLKDADKLHINDEELKQIRDYLQDDHSVRVSFCMGTMLGVIPTEHSIHPLKCFYPKEFQTSLSKEEIPSKTPKSKFIIARVIAVLSGSSNKVILSALSHNLNPYGTPFSSEFIQTGTVIFPSSSQGDKVSSASVLTSCSRITLYNNNSQKNLQNGINFLSKINGRWISLFTNSLIKDYENIDKTIKTQPFRVISRSRIENSLLVSFDQKIIQERYFSSKDASPGEVVQATVTEIHDWGLSVRLSDYFSGRIYLEHLFNTTNFSRPSDNSTSRKMTKEQLNYIKKHYQIGRSYKFKVLRYEYNDSCWNPLLLLTAKQALLNDNLPPVSSVDETLKVGQKITGYISRIYLGDKNDDSKKKFTHENSSSGDYIIVRFYGESYGSISYKEYMRHQESENFTGEGDTPSKEPRIGEVITVKIKAIDLINRSLRLTLGKNSEEKLEAEVNSTVEQSIFYKSFLSKFENSGCSYYKEFSELRKETPNKYILLGVTLQGLLFSELLGDLVFVPKYNISDKKNNSEIIWKLLRKLYLSSKNVLDLNSKLKELKLEPQTLNSHLTKQTLELDFENYTTPENNTKFTLNLNTKTGYLKHSIKIDKFGELKEQSLCLGYISHIDSYGFLVSILGSKSRTGIVPRHLISSHVFFDGKEELSRHFSIGETLLLKVVKIDDDRKKRITLSIRDLEDGKELSQVHNLDIAKRIIREVFIGLERDEEIIKNLLTSTTEREKSNLSALNYSLLFGRILKLKIRESFGSGIYSGHFSRDNIKIEILFKLVSTENLHVSEYDYYKGKTLTGLVLGGDYQESEEIGNCDSHPKYIYYICNDEEIIKNYNPIEKYLKSANTQFFSEYSEFMKSFIGKTKAISIGKEGNLVFCQESITYTISVLLLEVNQDQTKDKKTLQKITKLPIIVYSNNIKTIGNPNSMLIFESRPQVPINFGILTSGREIKGVNSATSNKSLGVGDKIQCKIIDHMKSYQGVIVQLPNKSFGRIQILDLDDDQMDKPLEMERYQIGKTIEGIIVDIFQKRKKVVLDNPKLRLKFALLDFDISSRISRIRGIQGEPSSRGNGTKDLVEFSQVQEGSVVHGYVSNSGKQGVFVRIGRDIVGRIKLRELTSGTITPEDAQKHFFIGKFIKRMIVTNVDEKEQRIDLSISKLDSDDIKLRLSQIDALEAAVGEEKRDVTKVENFNERLSYENLYVGRVLGGVIKNISRKFGLFIRLTDLKDNFTAFCKFSECLDGDCNFETISSVFKVGDNVLCKVLKMDNENERIFVGVKPSYFTDLNKDLGENDETKFLEAEKTGEGDEKSNLNSLDEENFEYRETETEEVSGSNEFTFEDDFITKREERKRGFSEVESNEESPSGNIETRNLNRKQKVQRQLEHEHRIRLEEEKGMKSHLNPTTIDDFERLLITHRDVSSLWIKYMSYYLDLGDLNKARIVAERSLRQISVKEEMERWNIWVAYINMEIVYGGTQVRKDGKEGLISSEEEIPKNIKEVLDRALLNVTDQKKMYIQIFHSLKRHLSLNQGLAFLEKGLKKFQTSRKLWVTYLTSLYEAGDQKKARDEMIQKSLRSVSKHKVIRLITDIGRLEFEVGNINRGRTIFENLLEENPKRMDLWSQYFDILTKLCSSEATDHNRSMGNDYIEMSRSVFNSCLDRNFKPRSMKTVFTKWLSFEKQFGSLQSQKKVQDLAISYVNRLESEM